MVPVRLRLRNFLSYGDDAPALDFGAFHVACLSGGNGQGKSALLDAVTWALWGEARKSSDSRKPDEQLLRVGAREMEVDFTFALGPDEHRIVRRYTQTASGKTSKPGLEFQAADGAGGWIALTAESVRATQDAIDARLGLDYETFVNSTFLLQGRSDEFTRKKPGERKLILAKILGLDRYDRLATAAGARWTSLRDRAAALETEAERLVAATESAGAWQADRDLLTDDIEATEAALAGLAAALADAATALSALDAAAREDEALADALRQTGTRRETVRVETERLDTQIAEADRLVGRAAGIEAGHARYEAVRARRTALDEKSIQSAALLQQAAGLRLEAQKRTAEAETRVQRLAVELDALRERVREDERQVATRDRARAALAASVAAEAERAALESVRTTREAARTGIEVVDKRLAAERGGLTGQKAELTGQAARLRTETAPVDGAAAETLERQVAEARQAAEALDAVRERGTTLSAAVQTLDAALARLDAEAAAVHDRQARIGETAEETCPTCGTPLTASHRAHVAEAYARDLAALTRQRQKAEADRAQAAGERDGLRAEYARYKAAADAGREAGERLAALRERAARRTADLQRLAAVEAELARVAAALDSEAFSSDLRARRATHEDTLAAHPFDAARYEAVQREAGLRDHHAGVLREIEFAAERLVQRVKEGKEKAGEERRLRAALDAGEPAARVREQLDAVERQAAAVGYDAAEHERVSAEMTRLAEAPSLLARLLEVRRSVAEWSERRATLTAEALALDAEAEALGARRTALRERLDGRATAEAARDGLAADRDAAARRLTDAHARRGALDERLEQAARDRAALAATRHELKDVKRERAIYTHLKRAFGRHGIPSLIIEETLPEVENRANVLLERLTGGTTRVSLETLKENKTGGTRETLDITITDAQGAPRAYEMYSGGEAFRVNFALRIALSQLLAERSGTQVRTLVVDEGFGTQDAEGLQALVSAITTIQDDFDKILVVTHLEELKAAFPVRIEVRKDPVTGSTFDVVGV